MCGLAGIVRQHPAGVDPAALRRMAAALAHRGPDGCGGWRSARAGLVHVRLSVVDVEGGAQPMTNEDGTVVVVYNGEVYNHAELRGVLAAAGHRFRTRCDTEVLVHGWEEWGDGLWPRLNGQFAVAIWDARTGRLHLARDRFGVRPLFHAERRTPDGVDLYFASEAKALFATGDIAAEPDVEGLDEAFTLWAPRAPRTAFRGVRALEPGTHACWADGTLTTSRFWAPDFPDAAAGRDEPADALEQLDALLRDSVALRMRADVPVGGYLSGGLDSSVVCALAGRHVGDAGGAHELRTFSIAFDDARYDESAFQQLVARRIGSRHLVRQVGGADIARVFPSVVWHAETPMLRTSPAPMYLLAEHARAHGIKVVLTGEGADELFLGYDLFREAKVRAFCLRRPDSRVRPRLLDRLYPYQAPAGRAAAFWRRFFLEAGPADDPLFSHQTRFRLSTRIRDFYSADMRAALTGFDALGELREALAPAFARWDPMDRAASLELATLLPSYLLAAQGDRMAMAHGVEGRFPFLDHRVFALAAALPPRSKLAGLREKAILKRWARDVVPREVLERPKQPYRAPDVPVLLPADAPAPDYVRELLAPDALRASGIFDVRAVEALVQRCLAGRATSIAEGQALVAIVSTQLWQRQFCDRARDAAPAHAPVPDAAAWAALLAEPAAGAPTVAA